MHDYKDLKALLMIIKISGKFGSWEEKNDAAFFTI
jgi:hypothetical protein